MEPDDPFAVPVPQGELLGEVPGVGVLGLAVDGCRVLPGVELFGDVDPVVVVFGVPLGEVEPGVCPGVVCGVAVPAGGVAVLAGGVAVLAGGVAGEPGVEVCPELLLEPPAGAPPPAELWAIAEGNRCLTVLRFGSAKHTADTHATHMRVSAGVARDRQRGGVSGQRSERCKPSP